MTDLHALLHKVCSDPSRPVLATPFGVDTGDARWDVASNGFVLLALPGARRDLRAGLSDDMARVLVGAPTATHTCTLADLREWAGTDDGVCRECDGAGWAEGATTCQRCDGEGSVLCDMDHEHDCPDCGGSGKEGRHCSGCGGRANRAILEGLVGSLWVNRCLLASVVHDLPGDVARIGIHAGQGLPLLALDGPGWRLLVAGLSRPETLNAPRLTLTPIDETTA